MKVGEADSRCSPRAACGERGGEERGNSMSPVGRDLSRQATHACRPGCAACCIAPSISSPIPGLPRGKPAGIPCPQLDENLLCRLFARSERPACCSGLKPSQEMCGESREEALAWLSELEAATRP
jgi:hypothetical protein